MPRSIDQEVEELTRITQGIDPKNLFALGAGYFDSPTRFASFLIYLSNKRVSPELIHRSHLLQHYAVQCSATDIKEVCAHIESINHMLASYLQAEYEYLAEETDERLTPIEPTIENTALKAIELYNLYAVFGERLISHLSLSSTIHQSALITILKERAYQKTALSALWRVFFCKEAEAPFSILCNIFSGAKLTQAALEPLVKKRPTQYLVLFLPDTIQTKYEQQLTDTLVALFSINNKRYHPLMRKQLPAIQSAEGKENMIRRMIHGTKYVEQACFLVSMDRDLIKQILQTENKKLDDAIARGEPPAAIEALWRETYKAVTLVDGYIPGSHYPLHLDALQAKMILHAVDTEADVASLLDALCVSTNPKERPDEKAHILFSTLLHLLGTTDETLREKFEPIFRRLFPKNIQPIQPTIGTFKAYTRYIEELIKDGASCLLFFIACMAQTYSGVPALSLLLMGDQTLYAALLIYLIENNMCEPFKIACTIQDDEGNTVWEILAARVPKHYTACITALEKSPLSQLRFTEKHGLHDKARTLLNCESSTQTILDALIPGCQKTVGELAEQGRYEPSPKALTTGTSPIQQCLTTADRNNAIQQLL